MKPFLCLCLLASIAVADEPAPTCCHVSRVIACAEDEESSVEAWYDAYLTVLSGDVLEAGTLTFPARLADVNDQCIIVSWSYYIAPNTLKGFEIAIPRAAVRMQAGVVEVISNLRKKSEDWKQGICLLELTEAGPGTRR